MGGCGVSVYYVPRSTKEQAKRKKIEKNIKKGRERKDACPKKVCHMCIHVKIKQMMIKK